MAHVLLSRTLDPLLGALTGAFAYYLYENNPRTAPPHEERLTELIRWKMEKRRQYVSRQEETGDWPNMMQESTKRQ